MPDQETTVGELRAKWSKFVSDRDWNRFHTAKNLSMAIAAEAAAAPAERKSRGAKARERILSHFSLTQAVDAYERLYLSLENNAEDR